MEMSFGVLLGSDHARFVAIALQEVVEPVWNVATPPLHEINLLVGDCHLLKIPELTHHVGGETRRIDRVVAVEEPVFHLRPGEIVDNRATHGELIEVVVGETGYDRVVAEICEVIGYSHLRIDLRRELRQDVKQPPSEQGHTLFERLPYAYVACEAADVYAVDGEEINVQAHDIDVHGVVKSGILLAIGITSLSEGEHRDTAHVDGLHKGRPYRGAIAMRHAMRRPRASLLPERAVVGGMVVGGDHDHTVSAAVSEDISGERIHGFPGTGHRQRTGNEVNLRVDDKEHARHYNELLKGFLLLTRRNVKC